jgi:hypothetical protein
MFPSSYADSRATFLQLCDDAGAVSTHFGHPLRGPEGEALATDVARFGGADAERVLIVCSGTHGIEGFCGAGIQASLLKAGLCRSLPRSVAVLFVHALNPYGFAHLRRTNEDNVDLNRNFRDHSDPYPDDSAYAEVHPMLVPQDWDGDARRAADAEIARFTSQRGWRAFQAAVCAGQYSFADGLFYGGRHETWSNRTWRAILLQTASHASQVAIMDLHSGLGARGACEIISGAAKGSMEHRLATEWFGDDIVFPGATSTAPAASGFMGHSLATTLPNTPGALVVAEFGTAPFEEILRVLRADNWLNARGASSASLRREINADMKRAFVGDDAPWQSSVLEQATAIYRRAVERLGAFHDER